MNISTNYGSYFPPTNTSQLNEMKTALQIQEKLAKDEQSANIQTAISATGAKGTIVDLSI